MKWASLNDLPRSNDPVAVLAHFPASMACLPITVLPIPGEGELDRDMYSPPRIFVAQQGFGRRWSRLGASTLELTTAPRMIEICEAGASFDHCRWQGQAGRSVLVEFADAHVQAITHGELRKLDLRTRHEVFDEKVSRIALELAEEALHGLPNGRLYAQGLCAALVGVLASRYATGGPAPSRADTGRLGALQRQRLTDLIHQHLSCDLSLTRLADEVGLSVHYFLRVFKATFGTTPHRYVQQRRIEAAAAALRGPGVRPIAQIALEHGFASQAHMTGLMRRHLGATPRMLRQGG